MKQKTSNATGRLTKNGNAADNQRDIIAQLNLVSEIGKQIVAINNLNELCLMIVGLVQNTLDYEFVGLWLVQPDAATMELKAVSTSAKVITDYPKVTRDANNHIVIRVWQTGEAYLANKFADEDASLAYEADYV